MRGVTIIRQDLPWFEHVFQDGRSEGGQSWLLMLVGPFMEVTPITVCNSMREKAVSQKRKEMRKADVASFH